MIVTSLVVLAVATLSAGAKVKVGTKGTWTPPTQLFDKLVASKMLATAKLNNSPPKYPSITTTEGQWTLSGADNWITGFFPSALYQMKKRECMCPGSTSVDGSVPDWQALGRTWAAGIVPLHWHNGQGHDVGFLSWPFVEELSLNPTNASATKDLVDFALELSSRYSPIVGCTKSWNQKSPTSTDPNTDFLVIMDNMMNMETLLQAYKITGNRTFYDIAIKHSDTTLKNHFRKDWGSYHVVNYNNVTGAVKEQYTAQGYADNSTWTRGEAWALHGYTRMYQYTKLARYLDAARNIAKFFLRRADENPDYLVWDFDAPKTPKPPADSSAAMITSAALQLLATVEMQLWNTTGADYYLSKAEGLITQTSKYAWNPSWQSILSNGTRDNHGTPHSNNTGLPYADYYWIKNGNYLLQTAHINCPNGKAANTLSCGSDLWGISF